MPMTSNSDIAAIVKTSKKRITLNTNNANNNGTRDTVVLYW